MTRTLKALGAKPTSDWEAFHPLDLDRLASRYSLEKIRPLWPTNALLDSWLSDADRQEDLSSWAQRLADQLQGEWSNNYFTEGRLWTSDLDQLLVLQYGVARLPENVVKAAHRRLFGSAPRLISGRSLELIGHAMFQPWLSISRSRHSFPMTWRELINQAEQRAARGFQREQELKELLSGWGNE